MLSAKHGDVAVARRIDLYSVVVSLINDGPSVTLTARNVSVRPDGLLEVKGIRGPTAFEGTWEKVEVTRILDRVEDM
jgi:hypothetical protein